MFTRYLASLSLFCAVLDASIPLESPRLQLLGSAPRSFDFAFATVDAATPDILVADFLSPALQHYPTDGTNFLTPSNFFVDAPDGNKYLEVADVDGDGAEDIVLLESDQIRWLRRVSPGTFASPAAFTVLNDDAFGGPLTGMQFVEVKDFDQDGRADLLITSSTEISLYLQTLAGGEYVRAVVFRGYSIRTVHTVDLNGDTHPDLLSNQGGTLGVSYWDPREDNFGAPVELPGGNRLVTWTPLMQVGSSGWVDTADLDGDGHPELFSPSNMTWYPGVDPVTNSNQPFLLGSATSLASVSGSSVLIEDVNADGFLDFLVFSGAQGALWTAAGGAGMSFEPPAEAGLGVFSSARNASSIDLRLHAVDLDQDGDKDIILPPLRVNNRSNGTLVYKTDTPAVVTAQLGFGGAYNPSFAEGSEFAGILVVLDRPALFDVTVVLQSSDGSALAGTDYTAFSESLTIPAGQTTASLPITLSDDTEFNGSRNFTVTMSGVSPAAPGGTLGYAVAGEISSGTVTIENDERVTIIVSDLLYTVEEIDESVTIELTTETDFATFPNLQVDYQTADLLPGGTGAAEAGSDYTATSGSLTFNTMGQVERITIPLIDNGVEESLEAFRVLLSSSAPFAEFFYDELVVEIEDDDISFIEAAIRSFLPPGLDGPLDDASGDGIPNIMAWSLALPLDLEHPASDPIVALRGGRSVSALMPLSFEIPDPARLNIVYTVEQWTDDGSWNPILTKVGRGDWTGEAEFTTADFSPGRVLVRVYGTSSPPFLLRLRVDTTP
jgi:hypothetical protein